MGRVAAAGKSACPDLSGGCHSPVPARQLPVTEMQIKKCHRADVFVLIRYQSDFRQMLPELFYLIGSAEEIDASTDLPKQLVGVQILRLAVFLQQGFVLLHAPILIIGQYQTIYRYSRQPPMVDIDSETALPASRCCSAS